MKIRFWKRRKYDRLNSRYGYVNSMGLWYPGPDIKRAAAASLKASRRRRGLEA